MTPHTFYAVFSFIFGAVVGSFLNVVIIRLPRGDSIVSPRSKCPECGCLIRWYDNIPIFSYFALGGRCRDCGSPFSIRYPLVELTTALIFLGLYLNVGITPELGVLFVLCGALIAVFWIDIDHMIIPDAITYGLTPMGLVAATAGILPDMTWKSSLVGIVLGALALYIPALAYEFIRGVEGLGGGDVKLLAMLGSFLGPVGVFFVLLVSSLVGSVAGVIGMAVGKAGSATPIPFGPFLVVGGLLYVFAGPAIIAYVFGVPPGSLVNFLLGWDNL
ncbi:MAG: prepilin peptidase [Deltaproteobacteria bacterium]|nr:prepilin peptidase [Deltaproteobacteria bacterium]